MGQWVTHLDHDKRVNAFMKRIYSAGLLNPGKGMLEMGKWVTEDHLDHDKRV